MNIEVKPGTFNTADIVSDNQRVPQSTDPKKPNPQAGNLIIRFDDLTKGPTVVLDHEDEEFYNRQKSGAMPADFPNAGWLDREDDHQNILRPGERAPENSGVITGD